MTMLANRTETRALTLADYEARIHLYKEQIGVGYIGIGRTLNEAKAAGVVPHGQWEAWVTETTGLTPRQAQRCMKAATEIRDGSAMAQLEMSKALMLLGSGLDADAQEAIAGKAAEEGATVRALKEEIRKAKAAQEAADAENERSIRALKLKLVQETGATTEIRAALKKAEADRDGLKNQLEATIDAYKKRMDEEAGAAYRRGLQDKAAGMEQDIRKEFQGKIDFLNSQKRQAEERVKDLQAELESSRKDGSQAWDQGFAAGTTEAEERRKAAEAERAREVDALQAIVERKTRELASLHQEAEGLRRNQGDLLAAAEEAEKRAADAEAALEEMKAGKTAERVPAAVALNRALSAFYAECEMMPWYPEQLQGDRQPILGALEGLEAWIGRMRGALDAAVPAEGAVL